MASADYLPLVQAARERVLRISAQQSRGLARIYAEIAADLRRESAKRGVHTLTYRFLMDYAKNLRKESEEIFAGQRDLIAGNLRSAAGTTVEAQRAFFAQAAPQLSGRFSDVFSRASQKAVNELLSGGIYENFAGLSERIWNYRGSFDRDISEIIRRGILAKKPAFDLAKDLELYLDPSAAKPWDWNKVYPGVSRKVDYNAQRLARTSVTHAYQLALERSTRDNPFVTKYQWLAGNSHARICGLCLSRDGKYFDKGHVPLDHPNGMCTIIPVIEKSYEEIAAELADWANGGENPALDNWLLNPKVPLQNTGNQRIMKLSGSLITNIQLFAKIPKEKFTKYALDPIRQPDKARAFREALGYTLENCDALIENIRQNIDRTLLIEKGDTGYGMRYESILRLHGPNGKEANVLTAWIEDPSDADGIRLVSVYVTERKSKV